MKERCLAGYLARSSEMAHCLILGKSKSIAAAKMLAMVSKLHSPSLPNDQRLKIEFRH